MAGRPTTYNDEVLAKARSYLNGGWRENGDVIPSAVGLCAYIERARSTVYKWRTEKGKEAFSDILEQIDEIQQAELLNKGLTGDFNSTIAKLVLAKHGYNDRVEQDITSGGEKLSAPIYTIVDK